MGVLRRSTDYQTDMRVCFLTPTLELHGGNLVMLKYAGDLVARGHEVTLVAPVSAREIAVPRGVRLVTYPARPGRLVFYSFQLVYLSRVRRCLADEFDVVIPVFTPLSVHAAYAGWRLRARFRIVLLYQDFFSMVWVGRYLRFLLGQRWLMRKLDRVIAVSSGAAAEFAQASGLSPVMIPNGIDEVFFEARSLSKKPYVLFVGRPGKSKGFDVFQQAMCRVRTAEPTVNAVLVSSAVADGQIEGITTVRYRDRAQLRDFYGRAMVYVHAAIGESFGLPPLEAMACGTACVVTDTVGTRDYARGEENCLLVTYGDHEGMAKAILRLVRDSDLRARLEEAGRRTAANYRWERSLARFEAELLDVVGRRPEEGQTRQQEMPLRGR